MNLSKSFIKQFVCFLLGLNEFGKQTTSRSLNTISISSQTLSDDLLSEVNWDSGFSKSQPKLVSYVGEYPSFGRPVNFRPIEPMPLSEGCGAHEFVVTSTHMNKKLSSSISVDNLPLLDSKTNEFLSEAKELYKSHFHRVSSSKDIKKRKSDFQRKRKEFDGEVGSFKYRNSLPHKSGSGDKGDRYKLRPTLETPPFPVDFHFDQKCVKNIPLNFGKLIRSRNGANDNSVEDQFGMKLLAGPVDISHKTVKEPHSSQSSQLQQGAKVKITPKVNSSSNPEAHIFQKQYHNPQLAQTFQDQRQSFCFPTCAQTEEPLGLPFPPGTPKKKRASGHQRSNSTPFPSPCNFIDLLADDPNTPRDPYNHYTSSQPSLANQDSEISNQNHGSEADNLFSAKIVTSNSAGNLQCDTRNDLDIREGSATLDSRPKKQRYIKHRKTLSNHSAGNLSGFTASSGSGITFR